MKCNFCGEPLRSHLLKQVDEFYGFEIECLKCRKYNCISAEAYFLLRKDENVAYCQPLNNKLPSEMNVIFVSLQRCAISWIIRVLSQYHEAMFGQPIPYSKKNAEISKIIATRKRFPLPQQWNCVYEVNPMHLLERGYDRIIVIERDLDVLEKVHEIYFQEDFEWQQRETFFRKLREAWHLVYDNVPEAINVMKMNLNDLNNRTKESFTLLMDFLNFPTMGRPPIIPISPPYRNWEAYSSILKNDENINNKLEKINKIFINNEQE
jgi:hypothetical protein